MNKITRMVVLLFLVTGTAHAQLGGLKDKAKQKLEEKKQKADEHPDIKKAGRFVSGVYRHLLGNDSTLTAYVSGFNRMNDIDFNDDKADLDNWPLIANALSAGEHQVEFKLFGGEKRAHTPMLAKGSFTYTKIAGHIVPYGYPLSALWDKTFLAGSPQEADAKAKVVAALGAEGKKLVKFGLTSNDWQVQKNDFGIIPGKYLNFQLVYKDKDGYYYYDEGNCYKSYEGAGKYGNSQLADDSFSGREVDRTTIR